MIGFVLKRITRSRSLFAILFFGVLISSSMFSTITLGTNELFLGMIDKALEEFCEEGDLSELMAGLMEELQTSPFFKALQRGAETK